MRSSFTKTFNQLKTVLAEENPCKDTVQKSLIKLERVGAELSVIDSQVLELLLDKDGVEDEYGKEHEAIEEFQDKLSAMRYEVEGFLVSLNPPQLPAISSSLYDGSNLSVKKWKFKLPKLEWNKYSGEIKDWLGFWDQFKKIHEDEDIASEDKFQYLVQATVKGSRAREIVESFPPTADNYPKAIESLKSRFGRDDLLVEVMCGSC